MNCAWCDNRLDCCKQDKSRRMLAHPRWQQLSGADQKSCVDRHHASSSQTFREPRCPRLNPSTQAWLHFGNGWGIIDASGRSLYDADLHALAGSSVARGLSDGLNRELDGSQVRTAVICFCPQLFCTARTARVLRNATARGAAQGHPLRELNLSQCLSILLDQALILLGEQSCTNRSGGCLCKVLAVSGR